MTKAMTQPEMAAFDARELGIYRALWHFEDALQQANDLVHRHAGDQRVSNGFGRPKTWGMSDAEARGRVTYLASSYNYPQDPSSKLTPSDVIAVIEQAEWETRERRQAIGEMEAEYAQAPWNRYFPCLNRDGHIHSSLRGCPTVRPDTDMGWATEMSGLTPDQAIHAGIPGQFPGLGETLCTVCFPEAPAQWCRTKSEVTKDERAAAKAAREEAKFAKRLRDHEVFRQDAGRGMRVETVNQCLQVLREEVEYRDFYGTGEHPSHADRARDAAEATRVLLAREAAHPGTGATQAKIDDVIAKAVAKNRKEGARI